MKTRLSKKLPKDFDAIARSGDIEAMQRVFERSAVNAHGNYSARTPAISFFGVPDEFVTWLVEQGADVNQPDAYGETPLHHHAGSWCGNPELILTLGGDLHSRDTDGQTALFRAMMHPEHVRTLIAAGIDVDARDTEGETALEAVLVRARTNEITEITASVNLLLAAGAAITQEMRDAVRHLSEDFEHIRADFNPETVDATDTAMRELCQLFEVDAAPAVILHDGVSPIVTSASTVDEQFAELWGSLVPAMGHADTVQGEAVRIVARVTDEIYGTGGANWNADYRRMLAALPELIAAHTEHASQTGPAEQAELAALTTGMRDGRATEAEFERLRSIVVAWIERHPTPIALPPQQYRR